jgi:hypothetical protein
MAFEVIYPKEHMGAFNMITCPKTINKQQRKKLKGWAIPLE